MKLTNKQKKNIGKAMRKQRRRMRNATLSIYILILLSSTFLYIWSDHALGFKMMWTCSVSLFASQYLIYRFRVSMKEVIKTQIKRIENGLKPALIFVKGINKATEKQNKQPQKRAHNV